jgi:uncharacterized membrane protein SpoIIM required for sporulation
MRPKELYEARQESWQRLNGLVEKGQKNIRALSPDEVRQLGRLYREATSDLALAQRDFPRHQIADYLNQLVGRAHAVIYQDEPLQIKRLKEFVSCGFPRLFRRTLPFTLLAALLFLLPALIGGFVIGLSPETAQVILPVEVQHLIPIVEQQGLWVNIPVGERPYASTFIMQNNIRVAFLAFASGMTGGLLTLWVLVNNGLILGGLTGLTSHYGVGFELWTFVIGHGVLELSVIFMAGGSGFMLGWAILHPGLRRRRDALTAAARDAVSLLLGAVPLLLVAGAIEGFLSPAEGIVWQVKWAVGLGTGLLLYSYLLLAGRDMLKLQQVAAPTTAFFPSTPDND